MLPVKSNLLPTVSKFFEDDWNNVFDWTNQNFKTQSATSPSVNIEEHSDEFILELAAPGLNKEDFTIEIKKDTLMVKGESSTRNQEEGKGFSRREFNYNSFQRSFNLNDTVVDNQSIEAEYKDGILRLRLAKKETAKESPAYQIEIK